jgi:tellurite resistance protein TerC
MTFDPQIIYIVVLIIFLEGILSIDNAAILGAMVAGLPANEAIRGLALFVF